MIICHRKICFVIRMSEIAAILVHETHDTISSDIASFRVGMLDDPYLDQRSDNHN